MTFEASYCLPHAFVVMPFGQKPGPDGAPIDFNRVYEELIQPALTQAGLEPFRADEEQRAGDIRSDMFQELLLADLVLADLTIDNPNVWYELGVRHALRSRGVVLISGGRVPTAFDLAPDRKFRYSLSGAGPDPTTLSQDRDNLVNLITSTMESWAGRRISPVYSLLPELQEPDWTTLRIGDVREFWEKYEAWAQRIELASKAALIGDVLVLADEAPVAAFRARAWIQAGIALRKAGEFRFAIEQLDRGLAIDPTNLKALHEKGSCLQRLALARQNGFTMDRAMAHFDTLLDAHPKDAETWALVARVHKDDWVACWQQNSFDSTRKQQEALDGIDTLALAQDHYLKGFRANPTHFYSGINALTLMHVARHLGAEAIDEAMLRTLAGAVRFTAESAASDPHGDGAFWALASLADLAVLEGTEAEATAAYRKATSLRELNRFDLDSCRAQLLLLQELGFRPEVVAAGLSSLDRAIARLAPQQATWRPRLVILFSGHMIDAPEREKPRFPPTLEAAASQRIEYALAELQAGADDLALCQAAAGGDLLFLEACQRRQVRCQVLLPFEEAEFIRRSIQRSIQGDRWRERYYAMRDQLDPNLPIRIMPEELGPAPKGRNPFERCNDWLLYTALSYGIERLRFLCLWDGEGGDGRGGTAHMVQVVEERTGRVIRIDTHSLTPI